MATSAQRSRKKPSAAQKTGGSRSAAKKRQAAQAAQESAITNEIILIGVFALTVLLFLCNFGLIGVVGDAVSGVMFGIFGLTAYAVPLLAFVAIAFGISNQGNRIALMKLIAGIVLFFLIGMICQLAIGDQALLEGYSLLTFYETGSVRRVGGGVLSGSLAWVSHHFLGMVGTVLLIIVLTIICLVIITEKSFVSSVKSSGRYVYETARTDAMQRRERSEVRREELRARRQEAAARSEDRRQEAAARAQERQLERMRQQQQRERQRQEEEARRDAQQILRMEKRVSGVMMDTALKQQEQKKPGAAREDMHEITLDSIPEETVELHQVSPLGEPEDPLGQIRIHTMHQPEPEPEAEEMTDREEPDNPPETAGMPDSAYITKQQETDLPPSGADVFRDMKEVRLSPLPAASVPPTAPLANVPATDAPAAKTETDKAEPAQKESALRPKAVLPKAPQTAAQATAVGQQMLQQEKLQPKAVERPYRFPPISLLQKNSAKNSGDSALELKQTALHLQETLETFGVRVTITDISQGPTVTRYELQPEQGVKVSKILSLQDDIKLNLAATDIRIEAPIPGKAAVGIEVPNKENTAVRLRELLETREFKEFSSKLSFAVGKDIGGKVVVSDIAKMPHMLIAGSTGSGKSVCINTLIMSILYKADPKDVKLILVDPKVVELSVYNGIPHLLIPVVTDPKKASAALQWGVAEMSDRYRRFADYNVRDLKGYNQKVEQMTENGEADIPAKMPQIVIIVDELADLMMVAPGEVEESICRLAQLARAAGIHLIIATQRPSVDVITGLIKANMPSRVAFAVSSGTDSRTILDMNGAEKLLGKGDMLFYPQGYSKPVRIQGAFVSDEEVANVVDFLKNQKLGNPYGEEIEEKLKNIGSGAGGNGSDSGQTEYDSYFADAGKFIIEKDKASIGMLQRYFRIGFNRAARIMDQLAEVGVVGEEEGTKPRRILMTMDEFEQLIEEIAL